MDDTSADQAPMDFTRIQTTSDGDSEFERELFQIFLEDCELRVAALKVAIDSGDLDALHREAHTMKGAGSNVGTTRLHTIAGQLEILAPEAIGDTGLSLWRDIEAEFARVKGAIDAYVDGL